MISRPTITKAYLFLLIGSIAISVAESSQYTVSARRINKNSPVIDSRRGDSEFVYNYNCAAVPLQGGAIALLVRCQNLTNPKDQYSTGPSVLGLTRMKGSFNEDNISFEKITKASVVFEPTLPDENFGTEDPRIVLRNKTGEYYLMYTAAQQSGGVTARLAEAITPTPQDKSSWNRIGPIIGDSWSKSGALLIRDDFPSSSHYLLYGDSSVANGLQWATSSDLTHWTEQSGVWLPERKDNFDSTLVEAGPMPLPLSDGNYLFIYNSARCCYPSKKPGWNIQYNVGWAILDKNDPVKILQRSSSPLMTPTTPWETGDSPYLGLTPNVIFLQGWLPYPGKQNAFVAFYGGADSVVGAAVIEVSIQ